MFLGGGLVLTKLTSPGMVWHRDTLTRLAAVLTLRGGIQLTQCAACVATFGDVALLGSSVLLGSQPVSWIEQGRKLPTMGKNHPKRKIGEFWGVWRIPIIRTLQDHRCISYAYPIRSYNIRILNQSLSISVCVNFEKPKTISFHMSSNVYINLNISVYIIRPYPSRASRGWYQQTTPTRNRRTTRLHQGTSMWFHSPYYSPLSSPYLSLGVVLGGD